MSFFLNFKSGVWFVNENFPYGYLVFLILIKGPVGISLFGLVRYFYSYPSIVLE